MNLLDKMFDNPLEKVDKLVKQAKDLRKPNMESKKVGRGDWVKILVTCNCFGGKQSQKRDKYVGRIGDVVLIHDGFYEVSMDEYQPDHCFASKVERKT